ncbi:MAG: hypothetical protein RLZZ116_603 [Planctomycetota bacterium]|jgi:hypothetical protein
MRCSRPALLIALVASLVVHVPTWAQSPATQATATSAAKPIRVAVIGASASAGFGCVYRETRDDGEYAASFRLIDMVKLACPELALVTTDVSSGFFFLKPVANGAQAAKRAREFKPDCVLALDFLFWYCYGDDAPDGRALTSEAQRLEKLEAGLKELESLEAPILVGDLPDMSPAVGKMLSPTQMPKQETLAKANARLSEWAKGRTNVRVLPLASMQRQLMEQNSLEIDGKKLTPTKDLPLLQRDALHPAPLGMAGLACAVASELKDAVRAPDDGCEPEPNQTIARARGELKASRRAPQKPASAPSSAK